ncbi:energy transducer TonB [Roseibium sp. Sym1]|uniref:energy transducer TonB n=1 Tax=Roseibium sp. Sym1 TaxID=3016006 RepID=UPI0022B473F5|nr:TonB family protein [Roseibium sp. Sym1]
MRFPRYLAAGAIVSVVLHGSGAAYFAKVPDEASIAASEGGGVSVIGSIEDLVAGAQADVVADTSPLQPVEPANDPLEPVREVDEPSEIAPGKQVTYVKAMPVQPVAAQVPIKTSASIAEVPVKEGVTGSEPVTAAEPVQPLLPEALKPVPTTPSVETARLEGSVAPEPARPVEQRPVQAPTAIARVNPEMIAKPVPQETEAGPSAEDPLAEVTHTPRTKPKPPVRKTGPGKTPDKKLWTARRKGAEASTRKGGEQVNSKTARSNANGRKTAKSRDGGSAAASDYKGKVVVRLRRAKRYPRQARRNNLEGTAHVAFTISRSGSVSAIRLTRSSGHAVLDQAALDMVRRASPMPKFPGDLSVSRMSLQVPVRFSR